MLLFFIIQFESKAKKTEKKTKKETKIRNQKKAKKRQEGRKKENRERERERERDREREIGRVGGQKRLRRNKGRHSKTNKNASSKGKAGFFNEKQRKETKKSNKRNK